MAEEPKPQIDLDNVELKMPEENVFDHKKVSPKPARSWLWWVNLLLAIIIIILLGVFALFWFEIDVTKNLPFLNQQSQPVNTNESVDNRPTEETPPTNNDLKSLYPDEVFAPAVTVNQNPTITGTSSATSTATTTVETTATTTEETTATSTATTSPTT